MKHLYTDKFQARVEQLMKTHHCPGIAVAIVQENHVASAGFGQANTETSEPCTADTIFDIASASKSLTAASVGLLIEDESHPDVRWDAVMSELLPDDFVMPHPKYTAEVTVEDILAHRSGMPGHDLSYLGIGSPKPDDARSITRNLRNLPLAAPIRTKYMYCNMMYTVATHLVEVKAEQSFADFLQARFFDPLGMDSTCLQPAAARARGLGDRIATGHHWVKKKGYSRFQTPDCPEAQGAGSIMTSANDFIKYVKALMNQEGPITERLYRDLIRMRTIANPNTKWLRPHTSAVIYTVGLEIYWYRGHMIVGHDGSIAGFGSRFFFLPDLKFGACIFGNSSDAATITGILSRELIDIVLEVPESERCQSSKHGIPTRFIEPSNAPPKATKSEPKQLYAEKQKPVKRNAQIQESNSEAEAQVLDLDAYTGRYWNAGYHTMIVEIKNDKLFIDATDRSFPLTLTFEHVSGQTKYIARETYVLEGGNNPLDTEFELHDNKAVRMGLNLEDEEGRMIWFDKVT